MMETIRQLPNLAGDPRAGPSSISHMPRLLQRLETRPSEGGTRPDDQIGWLLVSIHTKCANEHPVALGRPLHENDLETVLQRAPSPQSSSTSAALGRNYYWKAANGLRHSRQASIAWPKFDVNRPSTASPDPSPAPAAGTSQYVLILPLHDRPVGSVSNTRMMFLAWNCAP